VAELTRQPYLGNTSGDNWTHPILQAEAAGSEPQLSKECVGGIPSPEYTGLSDHLHVTTFSAPPPVE
jgi:hypothetical protein